MTTRILLTAVAAALLLLPAGCGTSTASSTHRAPRVLAQATGVCPLQPHYNHLPNECRWNRIWNGVSPNFTTPRRDWGVAYAFNCGTRARDFSFAAWLPGMDHMTIPGKSVHATRGSGAIMFRRHRVRALLKTIPAQFKVDATLMAIAIDSPCTWHVTAILGSKQDVLSAVPSIPALKPPWWT